MCVTRPDLGCAENGIPNISAGWLVRPDDQAKLHGQRLVLGESGHHVQQAFAGSIAVGDLIQPEEKLHLRPLIAACIFYPGHADESPLDSCIWKLPSDTFRSNVQEARTSFYQNLPSYMVTSMFQKPSECSV